jgi:hypothetical protein
MKRYRKLLDTYRFPGFRPAQGVTGIFGDPKALVIRLIRRGKKRLAEFAAVLIIPFTTRRFEESGISLVETLGFIWRLRSEGFTATGARR